MMRLGRAAVILASASSRHGLHSRLATALRSGCSDGGHPFFEKYSRRQLWAVAIASSAGYQWAAWESPRMATVTAPSGLP